MILCFHNSQSSPYPLTCSWLTHISLSVCPVACQVNRYPQVNLLSVGDILRWWLFSQPFLLRHLKRNLFQRCECITGILATLVWWWSEFRVALSSFRGSAFPHDIPPGGLFCFLFPTCVFTTFSFTCCFSLLCRLFLLQLCPLFFVVIAWGSEGLRAGVQGDKVKSECLGAQRWRRSGQWRRDWQVCLLMALVKVSPQSLSL